MRRSKIPDNKIQTGLEQLRQIEWLLKGSQEGTEPAQGKSNPQRSYGDLTELNRERLILDSLGKDVLNEVISDYLDLLDSSAAVYEYDGSYASGIFTSSWCRFMDETSRNLCQGDNKEALSCGQWHCHESCWQTSKTSMDSKQPADLECAGGIRIYAVPIFCDEKIIGSINFGYGDPPTDESKLQELAERYGVPVQELKTRAQQYRSRPTFIIELAKRRLATAAKLIGEMVQRRQAEERYRELSHQLAQSNEELKQFAYAAAHDLQEPLRTVVNYVSLLSRRYQDKLDNKADKYIENARQGAQRMQALIDDLLQYATVQYNQGAFKQVDLSALVDRVSANLRITLEQTGGHVSRDELPIIEAEESQLAQVFQNLIGNGLKFHSSEPPAVHVSSTRGERQWQFSVSDNGMGLNMEYSERIFALFRRLVTSDEYPGTGMGLAICKKIIEHHGGRIWVESEPGKGSTFFFTIPDRTSTTDYKNG